MTYFAVKQNCSIELAGTDYEAAVANLTREVADRFVADQETAIENVIDTEDGDTMSEIAYGRHLGHSGAKFVDRHEASNCDIWSVWTDADTAAESRSSAA